MAGARWCGTMARMRTREAAVPAAGLILVAGCNAIFGFEEGTPLPATGVAGGTTTTGAAGSTPSGTSTGGGGAGGGTGWHHDWSEIYAGDGYASASAVAVTAMNNIVLGGDFTQTIDFGGDAITTEEPDIEDGYVAVLDADGSHRWTRRLGSYRPDHVSAIAVSPASDVLAVGSFVDHFEVHAPGGPHWDAGFNEGDIFVVKLDAAGDFRWGQLYGDELEPQAALGVAADAAGNAVVTGCFDGIVDFGNGDQTAQFNDVFVLRLDSGGSHISDARLGGTGDQRGHDVAVTDGAQAVVAGGFTGQLTAAVSSTGGTDAFVAKYDSDALLEWALAWGDAEDQQANAVALDGQDIIVVGQFRSQIDFGGSAITSHGSQDGFIVKLDSDGQHLWSHGFGGPGDDVAHDVAVGPTGNIVATGEIAETVIFGDCVLDATDEDVFVLVLDTEGTTLWCERFGDAGTQAGRAVAVDSSGAIVLHGNATGSIDFGGGELVATGASQSVFVARFAR